MSVLNFLLMYIYIYIYILNGLSRNAFYVTILTYIYIYMHVYISGGSREVIVFIIIDDGWTCTIIIKWIRHALVMMSLLYQNAKVHMETCVFALDGSSRKVSTVRSSTFLKTQNDWIPTHGASQMLSIYDFGSKDLWFR